MENIIKNVKCKIVRQIYASNNFRTFGCILTDNKDEDKIVLNKYGNFTISGDLPFLNEGEEYTLDLKETTHPRFGVQYTVDKVADYEMMSDLDYMPVEQSKEILTKFTTEKQADTLLSVYPNFISMIINGKANEIDLSKLKNIKEYRMNCYIREINTRFKYYYILANNKQYKLTIKDCQELDNLYGTVEHVDENIQKYPYKVFMDNLHRSFPTVDKMLMEIRPELKETNDRIEHLALHILNLNEEDNNTYMDANTMAMYCAEIDKDCIKHIKDICINSPLIWYDDESKRIAKAETYIAESNIANFILDKIKNNKELDLPWEKYKKIKDGELTEEQSELLHQFCKKSIVMLTGRGGCVDCETEFFTGTGWKKISEYNKGDKVLQYNWKTGITELVTPINYIKEPCNEMIHFETKYGLNQTLTPDHICYYLQRYKDKSAKELTYICKDKFTSLENIIDINNTFTKGFTGKFVTTFKLNPNLKGIDLTDDEIKIMCAVICDGSFYNNMKDSPEADSFMRCRFHIKKERKKEALRNLFNKSKIWWREKESAAEGYTDFYINAPRKEKEFTKYWYGCNQHQLQIICDNILQWDGNVADTAKGTSTRRRFSTTIKATADFIQYAFSACGYRANIFERDRRGTTKKAKIKVGEKEYTRKSIDYDVQITVRPYSSITKDYRPDRKNTEFVHVKPTDGYKYCFEVPTGVLVLRRNNCIFVTGNCGKTSAVLALLSMLDEANISYTLLSPTGRAAQRLSEQTNRHASTIHKRCLTGEIDSDVIIVDEVSICGLDHFSMILKACTNPKARIILIGDNHQLPSISLGNVLNDLINSKLIPQVELTKVFRYGQGGLSAVASDIYDKKLYTTQLNPDKLVNTLGANKDYILIKANGTLEQIVDIYVEKFNKGIKPIDIAVITPWNVKELGTYNLNNMIQSAINPAKANERSVTKQYGKVTITFRKGDIVMNTKNNYSVPTYEGYKEMLDEGNNDTTLITKTIAVFNGDIGKVLEIDQFNNIIIQFNEEMVVFDYTLAQNLVLGYCGTIHKYQGSQCPHIILLTETCHEKSYNNNLLYTGISRASKEVTHIADIGLVNRCIPIDGNENRQTQLKDLLLDGYKKISEGYNSVTDSTDVSDTEDEEDYEDEDDSLDLDFDDWD